MKTKDKAKYKARQVHVNDKNRHLVRVRISKCKLGLTWGKNISKSLSCLVFLEKTRQPRLGLNQDQDQDQDHGNQDQDQDQDQEQDQNEDQDRDRDRDKDRDRCKD